MSSVSTKAIMEKLQEMLVAMGAWDDRVVFAIDEDLVPAIRALPMACLVVGSVERELQTDENSDTVWTVAIVQYFNIRTLEYVGVGREGVTGLYDIWEKIETTLNRSSLEDLADMVWVEKHEKPTPVGSPGDVEPTMVRAITRVKIEGFKEG